MRLKGNKGEWSELYAFVKLLADGKLYAAEANLKKKSDAFSNVISVQRKEVDSFRMEYVREDKHVDIYCNGDRLQSVTLDRMKAYSELIYSGIVQGGKKASFYINGTDEITDELKCTKLKAPSEDKADIILKIHDRKTGYDSMVGYSIKSELGSPPTLLNASGATNFRFHVSGLKAEDIKSINAIDTRSKIQDRIVRIKEKGYLKFDCVKNRTFGGNLMLIDSMMDEILAFCLVEYYTSNKKDCTDIISRIENIDPLGYNREGIYRYKMKKFLSAIALGLKPSKRWDGQDEATGGYIIVKENSEVVAFHLYNRNSFETYLLNETHFETGSTSKHGFGSIYEEEGKNYINLNLQVRFN